MNAPNLNPRTALEKARATVEEISRLWTQTGRPASELRALFEEIATFAEGRASSSSPPSEAALSLYAIIRSKSTRGDDRTIADFARLMLAEWPL